MLPSTRGVPSKGIHVQVNRRPHEAKAAIYNYRVAEHELDKSDNIWTAHKVAKKVNDDVFKLLNGFTVDKLTTKAVERAKLPIVSGLCGKYSFAHRIALGGALTAVI